MRRLAPWLALAVLLIVPATAGAHTKSFGGVVPDVRTGARPPGGPLARAAANLPYGGGPVMHSNRTHVIFWTPAGSPGLTYDPGYQGLVQAFMANVAADSHTPANVYGLSGQYHDAGGPAAYASSYAGAVTATDPLPVNGCSEPPAPPLGTGPGWNVCLSDTQLEAEIAHVAGVNRLPQTGNDVYFLVMPNGMGSCEGVGPDNCALGGDAAGSYCGYHSNDPEGTLLYAVIPYNALAGHCQSGNPRPNASTADPTLSTISHEHSETVTDPLGSAWLDGAGNENGDLCLSSYGPNLGGAGAGGFNQVIHGGHYYLQNEFSNEDHGCRSRDEADSVGLVTPRRATVGRPFRVSAQASDPDGSISHYDWYFGQGRPGRRLAVSHTYSRAGTYRIVLRVTDSAGNWAFQVAPIQVARAPAKAKTKGKAKAKVKVKAKRKHR